MYETIRIVNKLKPKYVIWENVKNLLSSKHIHNFQAYVDIMTEGGYNSYYQVLNAKNYVCEDKKNKLAIFYGKESFVKAMQFSKTVKETYDVTLFEMPNKFGKFLNKLAEQGFKNYCVYDEGAEIKELKTF